MICYNNDDNELKCLKEGFMDERVNFILNNIDLLIEKCRKRIEFEEIANEARFLIEDLLGKDSKEYKKFLEINAYFFADKYAPLKGLLASIKNHIIICGLKNDTKVAKTLSIHPSLIKVSQELYNAGYYTQSVDASIKEINVRLKNLYIKYRNEIKNLDGYELFCKIFNEKNPLLIAGDNLTTTSGINEHNGYRYLFMGMWCALRNPNAHANKFISIHEATNQLHFLSMLMYKIDICVIRQNLEE